MYAPSFIWILRGIVHTITGKTSYGTSGTYITVDTRFFDKSTRQKLISWATKEIIQLVSCVRLLSLSLSLLSRFQKKKEWKIVTFLDGHTQTLCRETAAAGQCGAMAMSSRVYVQLNSRHYRTLGLTVMQSSLGIVSPCIIIDISKSKHTITNPNQAVLGIY